jgi:hypothetical protein
MRSMPRRNGSAWPGSWEHTGIDGLALSRYISLASGDDMFIPLTTPLTSTAWDGDAHSTTAKTLIDLSAVFGAPAGIKAVSVRIACRDSGSATTNNLYTLVGPENTAGVTPVIARPSGLPNDYYAEAAGVCPCDTNGDIYYQIAASGAGTMDVHLQIWGYWT